MEDIFLVKRFRAGTYFRIYDKILEYEDYEKYSFSADHRENILLI